MLVFKYLGASSPVRCAWLYALSSTSPKIPAGEKHGPLRSRLCKAAHAVYT